ncbi:hypothetical protein ADINL_1681 [Nitrincola lacisaponensis]|uniref:Uncharacterized protein n=1 Tax=Nitrincola lacisaponensis TaxID=267850 RepID=A0A063Y2Z7_9GAMM|nr:hypothetical protein ADINL_1681 [Nitrincola lacisaponensis]
MIKSGTGLIIRVNYPEFKFLTGIRVNNSPQGFLSLLSIEIL